MDEIELWAGGPVDLTLQGDIALLELQRPAVRNAVSAELLDSLLQALGSPVLDQASALVMSGAGGGFCAGADLATVRAAMDGDTDAVLGSMVNVLHDIVLRLRSLPMPVVAAVEGVAVGAGMGLALSADLRVVGRSAAFLPGYLALGVSPDAGVSYYLSRALGSARATSALLLNEPLPAVTLLDQGLAAAVVEDGQALPVAVELARRAAGVPRRALLATRRLIDLASTQALADHLDSEAGEFRSLWSSAEFREGVTAFVERRLPSFTRPAPTGAVTGTGAVR